MSVETSLSVLLLILLAGEARPGDAVIREGQRVIPTYPYSDPDPVPMLVRDARIYPYFAFDGYSHESEERTWTVVRLENDYIAVEVLPEVGGKVFGAIDKSTGKEFVYRNDALKFRNIALRGPWTSGGVEFNYGVVGHAPSTASPVDYLLRDNPDGSVSCFVGTMDLPSRTRWCVEIRLPADAAWFETHQRWFNPSPYKQSYYTWSTAAVEAKGDLQYFYPGDRFVRHSTTVPPGSWPVDEKGRNLSWYRENAFGGSKSHFVYGEYASFFGVYWHESDFGFGHWAPYDEMPGQKVWLWALSRAGGIWEDLLTDTHGQYSEPQAGRLFSQADHEFFPAHATDSWREVWYPFKDIGGLVAASPRGVMNVKREEGAVTVGVSALEVLGRDLVVLRDDVEVHRERVELQPTQTFETTFALPAGKGLLEVTLGSDLRYSEDPAQTGLQRPFQFGSPQGDTPESLFQIGEYHEKRRELDQAMDSYRACLEGEPRHIRALVRLAELFCRRGEYPAALAPAKRALGIQMYDAGANYIYGVVSRRLGHLVDAIEALGWAARSLGYRSNALCQIAEIHVIKGEFRLASEYLARSLEANSQDLRARQVLAIVLRKLGRPDDAQAAIADLRQLDPLGHLAGFEDYLGQPSAEKLRRLWPAIRHELPHETVLEIAALYHSLGLDGEAKFVLEHAPDHLVILYWRSYLQRHESETVWTRPLEQAKRLSADFAFPFREETLPVLEWVHEQRPSDWKAAYCLGLVYWAKGRRDDARQAFAAAGAPDFAPFQLAKGHLLEQLGINGAEACFRKAVEIDPGAWRCWHHMASHLRQSGQGAAALEVTEEAVARLPDHVVLLMDHAGALMVEGEYARCLAVLELMHVLPYEGSWEAHDLWRRAHLRLGIESMKAGEYREAISLLERSREYPERLGAGRPFDPDFRVQDLLEGVCREKLGEAETARMLWAQASNDAATRGSGKGPTAYVDVLVLEKLGRVGERDKALDAWKAEEPGDPFRETLAAMLKGSQARGTKLPEETTLRVEVVDVVLDANEEGGR